MADTTSLHLRLPKRLYKRLQQQARRNNVSLNTEIVNQVEGSEAATVKRVAEAMKPLVDDATTIAIAVKMTTGVMMETLAELGQPLSPELTEKVLAAVWDYAKKNLIPPASGILGGVPEQK